MKKNKLTKKEIELLVKTPDDLLLRVFPGHERWELRTLKKIEVNKIKEREKPVVEDYIKEITEKQNKEKEKSSFENEKKILISEIDKLEKKLGVALNMQSTPQEVTIKSVKGEKISAVPFVVASDWHVEEVVKKKNINNLNEFNLEIADERINNFFVNSLKLLNINAKDTYFNTVVLALLGDFISGNIHEELLENTSLRPMEAILWVSKRIEAGISFLLENTKYNFIVPCHVGNHGRITKQLHISTEIGNSLETIMYHFLANKFSEEKRIQFIIADGYHTYINLFGKSIRLHHGHAIKYGGGIGGVFPSCYKAISQWDKAKKSHLDVFGHFHQLKNGGNFICNGSLIGYNSYALNIKADFEPPRQKFFMFTSTGEVTAEYSIFL